MEGLFFQLFEADGHMCEAECTCLMNVFISTLYSEGFWIPSERGLQLGKMLSKFLNLYGQSAVESHARGLNRFRHIPKGHMLDHTARTMQDQARSAEWIENPLSTANQQQEDYIGRPCRLSRRVHAARLHTRVLQRSLIASALAFQDAS